MICAGKPDDERSPKESKGPEQTGVVSCAETHDKRVSKEAK
jgi:hypothetical protein